MKRQIFIKALSGLVNISICLIGAVIVLFFQDWFGSGDTYSLIFWTIPLATGLAFSGRTILALFRTGNKFFRLLLSILTAVIISFGFVYLVYMFLGPMINAFSIPISSLWIAGSLGQLIFLDWKLPPTNKKLKPVKTVLAIIAFPLTVILTIISIYAISLAGSYLTRPKPETFLIPSNFDGPFRIIYGEKCGIDPSIENGRRILEIPENGILIIQPEFEAGFIDHEYYFIDLNGKKVPIKQHDNYETGTKSIPGVSVGGSGVSGGAVSDGSGSSESPLAIRYTDLHLFTKNSKELSEREYWLRSNRFDSLAGVLVEKCRENNND